MKIVSWNCGGAFRKKLDSISRFNADLYVIQECEDPSQANDLKYKEWASNFLWKGDNKNKGLGIFASDGINLKALDWSNEFRDHTVKHFLPCVVNDDFQLLGVWTHKNNSPNFGYMGQFWKYLQTNIEEFQKILIAGDFNSNAIWDEWDRWWNHTDVVEQLNKKGISSLYHENSKEQQGKETIPTFYLHKNRSKPYHIDYVFGSQFFKQNLSKLSIGEFNKWEKQSDHVPIVCEFRNSPL